MKIFTSRLNLIFILYHIITHDPCCSDINTKRDAGTKDESIPQKESAFDEIQEINKDVNLEHYRPSGKHVVEGDIMVRDGDQAAAGKRQTIRDDLRLWRTRQIAYVISPELESITKQIKEALDEISGKSCLTFTERKLEIHFLLFTKNKGCWSSMGMQQGGQEISIGEGCEKKEIIQHEVLHSLGFYHEQSRPDRDKYIAVNWNNIRKGYQSNFRKAYSDIVTTFDLPYDVNSLMHYGNYAFGDGRTSIESIKDPTLKLGNKNGPTDGDIQQLDLLYHCKSIPSSGYGPWKLWSPCEGDVKRKYRLCYGKDECPGVNMNGVQHVRMKCDESQKALMKGCFHHKDGSPARLRLEVYATKQACSSIHEPLHRQTPLSIKVAYAFLECTKHAKRSSKKVFGISDFCKCHYGDDDINISQNGDSGDCGDGHATTKDSIYMYRILE